MKRILIAFFTLITINFAHAQNDFKNRIGVNIVGQRLYPDLFTNDYNYTINSLVVPQGISYQHLFKYFTLRANLNYHSFTEETKGDQCRDCLYGTVKEKGIEFKIGGQKEIHWKDFLFYAGLDLGYLNLKSKGILQGGFDGEGLIFNSKSNGYGLNPFVGLGYSPIDRILLTVETGYYVGKIYQKTINQYPFNPNFTYTATYNQRSYIPIQALTLHLNF